MEDSATRAKKRAKPPPPDGSTGSPIGTRSNRDLVQALTCSPENTLGQAEVLNELCEAASHPDCGAALWRVDSAHTCISALCQLTDPAVQCKAAASVQLMAQSSVGAARDLTAGGAVSTLINTLCGCPNDHAQLCEFRWRIISALQVLCAAGEGVGHSATTELARDCDSLRLLREVVCSARLDSQASLMAAASALITRVEQARPKLIFLDIDGVLLPLQRTGQVCSDCGEDEENHGCVFVTLLPIVQNRDKPICMGCACQSDLEEGVHYTRPSCDRFPRTCLSALERIIQETGAEIVLSSTWRMTEGPRQRVLDEFQAFGGDLLPSIEEFQYFTNLQEQTIRQWEIGEWLEANGHLARSWVVLDDDLSVTQHARFQDVFRNKVVQTDPVCGLTDEDASNAIEILNFDSVTTIEDDV